MLHRLVGVDRAAAGGDDGVLGLDLAQDVVFDLDEAVGAAGVDELLQRLVALLLDQQVGVEEAVVQDLGQHDAQRGLARARHADEDDVVGSRHCSALS